MSEIRYTLLSEGTSDKALLPILTWLLQCHLPGYAVQAEWADLARLPQPPKSLPERIQRSLELYPCQVLFIHRDADNQGREQRLAEIGQALAQVGMSASPTISVIPVRMTEAWLLLDEAAIRTAADNPKGSQALQMPNIKNIEQHADPKTKLHELLRQASGAKGRRLKKFDARLSEKVQRLAEITYSFSPLRKLSAFQALEADVENFAKQRSTSMQNRVSSTN